MSKPQVSFFFTALDDDFILKGARDPLGFQIIWQNTARRLIPHLNTVCGNLRDWQIICMGHVLYHLSNTSEDIIPFFIRFEQLMAHARLRLFPDEGFNGVDKTKRIRNEGGAFVKLGNKPNGKSESPELLANQRSYGIWGKYISPFKDVHLQQAPGFQTLWKTKLEDSVKDSTVGKLLKAVKKPEGAQVRFDELEVLEPLLTIGKEECIFFQRHLLKHPDPAHIQNQIYSFCEKGISFVNLYSWLQALAQNGTLELVSAVRDIQQTEQVLCPLNRFFRALQKKAIWNVADVEGDKYFLACCHPVQNDGLEGRHINKKRELSSWFNLPIQEFLMVMLKENKAVAAGRGGSPWMSLNSNGLLEVHHTEGSYRNSSPYQQGKDYDNNYFLNTYINLYNQAKFE